MKNSRKVTLTTDQVKELKTLCAAAKAAEEAKKIRGRFKAFMEDNEEALKDGVEVAGLRLGIHYSKQLTVEEA